MLRCGWRLIEAWGSSRLSQNLGPDMGRVGQVLSDDLIAKAIPSSEPSNQALGPNIHWAHDSGSAPAFSRANKWAAAIDARVTSDPTLIPEQAVMSTIGFVVRSNRLTLALIHYLRMLDFLFVRNRGPITIEGQSFPTIHRMWRPPTQRTRRSKQDSERTEDTNSRFHDGNPWVVCVNDNGHPTLGMLVPEHCLPRGARKGDNVTITSMRRTTVQGQVREIRSDLDASIVDTGLPLPSRVEEVRVARIPGFKPVRYMCGDRTLDAMVVEIQCLSEGAICTDPNINLSTIPARAATFFLSASLSPGDSGCLVVDCEHIDVFPDGIPYLMYIARQGRYHGSYGVCSMLEQCRVVMGINFVSIH